MILYPGRKPSENTFILQDKLNWMEHIPDKYYCKLIIDFIFQTKTETSSSSVAPAKIVDLVLLAIISKPLMGDWWCIDIILWYFKVFPISGFPCFFLLPILNYWNFLLLPLPPHVLSIWFWFSAMCLEGPCWNYRELMNIDWSIYINVRRFHDW